MWAGGRVQGGGMPAHLPHLGGTCLCGSVPSFPMGGGCILPPCAGASAHRPSCSWVGGHPATSSGLAAKLLRPPCDAGSRGP